jgi:hypothetical protein
MRLQWTIVLLVASVGFAILASLPVHCFGADNGVFTTEVVASKGASTDTGQSFSIIYSANMKSVITPCG